MIVGALKQAPSFILNRMTSVLDGIILAYFTVLFWWSGMGFFATIWHLFVVAVVAFVSMRCVQVGITRGVRFVEEVFHLSSASAVA